MSRAPTKSKGGWLSPQDAAKLAGVSTNHLCKLAQAKVVKAKKTPQGNLYQKASIKKYAATRPGKNWNKGGKAKNAGASGNGVGDWVDNTTAVQLSGLTRSGIEYAARVGHIRRKKISGVYHYASADCTAYGEKKPSRAAAAPTTDNNQPAYMNGVNGRMKPKQAQTAVQKARWVFEGLQMGTVNEANALTLIRDAMYEGGN